MYKPPRLMADPMPLSTAERKHTFFSHQQGPGWLQISSLVFVAFLGLTELLRLVHRFTVRSMLGPFIKLSVSLLYPFQRSLVVCLGSLGFRNVQLCPGFNHVDINLQRC
ncbi:hypothetical protein ILYODFUR_011147 [Ilyodon furcidens]|uniref:Uncharacterized protein n=1 Tax=Ilyodon furcidens TaxID=33524 RepID=A0ABV0UF41_9TELE